MNGISSANAPALDLPARFMALSMLSLAAVAVSAPWALGLLAGSFSEFSLLAFVHLNTLGFVGAMIIGASYQLVPVALQVQLASVRLGRLSFWFYLAGLITFLTGLAEIWLPVLAAGGALLAVAFLLYIGVIFATWLHAPHHDVVAWHLLAGLLGAGVGMTFGLLLALNLNNGMLGARSLHLLAAHIVVMLGGWIALTFMGVAYRLIGMFTLAERHFQNRLAWTTFGLSVTGIVVVAASFALALSAPAAEIGALLLVAGLLGFFYQMNHLYLNRMRRAFDIHVPFAIVAAVLALVAAALLALGLIDRRPGNDALWVATVWLALLGAAGTAIQGFFYKIATFLVWLKRYAPVAGRQRVPKLEELYNRRLAMAGWGLWVLAIIATPLLVGFGVDGLAETGVVMLAAVVCFLINVVGIARHWFTGWRPSPGHLWPLRGIS